MILLYSRWLALPIGTRHAIALAFGIKKKNPTHVIDNYVREDGYVIGDIETALTATAMENFVGGKFSDANTLFDAVIAKVAGGEPLMIETIVEKVKEEKTPEPIVEEKPVAKKVTPKKTIKK